MVTNLSSSTANQIGGKRRFEGKGLCHPKASPPMAEDFLTQGLGYLGLGFRVEGTSQIVASNFD